jgi:hypothetical protein
MDYRMGLLAVLAALAFVGCASSQNQEAENAEQWHSLPGYTLNPSVAHSIPASNWDQQMADRAGDTDVVKR